MAQEIHSPLSSVATLKLSSYTKAPLEYNLSCLSIDFDLQQPYDICFPNMGYIALNFTSGSNFHQSFLSPDLLSGKKGHLYISGLLSGEPAVSRQQGKGSMNVMKLHPVIGYHMFKETMNQMIDQLTSFTDILGKKGQLLHQLEVDQQIESFANHNLEKFLLKNLPDWSIIKQDPIYHAVNTIIRKKGMIRVKDLAEQCCMSERTLNRQFIMKVGLSPKAYAKIWQWTHVAELIQKHPLISLQDLAYMAGYYDIPHIIHDFKDRTSKTPSEFQQQINFLIQSYLEFPDS